MEEFSPGEFYHVFSRSVEKRKIFNSTSDNRRFMELLNHCLPQGPIRSYSIAKQLKQKPQETNEGEGLVDILCYCLMPNHFHLLLKENVEHGITAYMQRLLTSYSRYFNIRYKRSGSLFINPFKAVMVNTDEQLIHLSRYIHLNPHVARLTKNALQYQWSSIENYVTDNFSPACHSEFLREIMPPQEYKKFVTDHADYKLSLIEEERLMIDFDVDTPN